MTTENLVQQIKLKKSMLCVGLDVDLEKIPQHLLKLDDPIFEFNKEIIKATADFAVAYKPNLAFYEAYGLKGWKSLEKTISFLQENYPNIFTIADAKRGDIGNTSRMYAKAFFEDLGFDSVTVAPYMGKDSVEPFLEFPEKHVIMLGLTSNQGSEDFQLSKIENDTYLFEKIMQKSKTWNNSERLMYVVGATKPEYLKIIRKHLPDSFLLVPGVGAQGGNLDEVCKYGMSDNYGLLINSSRGIIYKSSSTDFAEEARAEAERLQKIMSKYID
ncbi:MAG: orotidine-5'-phosphate decarboxylase [Psychroflexus halocasei]